MVAKSSPLLPSGDDEEAANRMTFFADEVMVGHKVIGQPCGSAPPNRIADELSDSITRLSQ